MQQLTKEQKERWESIKKASGLSEERILLEFENVFTGLRNRMSEYFDNGTPPFIVFSAAKALGAKVQEFEKFFEGKSAAEIEELIKGLKK